MLLIMDTYIQMKLTINPATRRGFCFSGGSYENLRMPLSPERLFPDM
nr:MAG TPA: defensin [Caudoviricetes sp.]DAP96308.1 MAG TPA: defensin [Caudoviricetes sp.]